MAIFWEENDHFPGLNLPWKSETKRRQIPTWKKAIFQGKSQPGKWSFPRPGIFLNSGGKMTISHVWVSKILGVKWPFSRPGIFRFGVKNGHLIPLIFACFTFSRTKLLHCLFSHTFFNFRVSCYFGDIFGVFLMQNMNEEGKKEIKLELLPTFGVHCSQILHPRKHNKPEQRSLYKRNSAQMMFLHIQIESHFAHF